jgi:hypothetical protein
MYLNVFSSILFSFRTDLIAASPESLISRKLFQYSQNEQKLYPPQSKPINANHR